MKIKGVDVGRFGAKQLKVERQAPQEMGTYEWVEGAAIPRSTEENITASTLIVHMKFSGSERDEIMRNISSLLTLLTGETKIILDGYKGTFCGYLKTSNIEKTIVKEKYRLQIELEGYFFDEDQTEELKQIETYMYVSGSRKTPCTIHVKAKKELVNYSITGDFGTITIESLETGHEIVINGENGTVTVNGENAFSKIDLWKFPELIPGENKITITDETAAEVSITYKPMWL